MTSGAVVSFVDTRSGYARTQPGSIWERFYHKKRTFVFGSEVVQNHVYFSKHPICGLKRSTFARYMGGRWRWSWTAYLSPDQRRALAIDGAFWPGPLEHTEVMRKAMAVLGLDFAALDYSVDADGQPILWEANPYFDLPDADQSAMPRERRLPTRIASYDRAIGRFLGATAGGRRRTRGAPWRLNRGSAFGTVRSESDLVASDGRYFEAGARRYSAGAARVSHLPGFEALASGCVVHEVRPRADRRRCGGLGAARGGSHSRAGMRLQPAGIWTSPRRPRSWRQCSGSPGTVHESSSASSAMRRRAESSQAILDIRAMVGEPWRYVPSTRRASGRRSSRFTASRLAGPMDTPFAPEAWTAMERRKCDTGYMHPYLIEIAGKPAGAVNVARSGTHPAHEERGRRSGLSAAGGGHADGFGARPDGGSGGVRGGRLLCHRRRDRGARLPRCRLSPRGPADRVGEAARIDAARGRPDRHVTGDSTADGRSDRGLPP